MKKIKILISVVAIVAVVIISSRFIGFKGIKASAEMVKMIDKGQEISIEVVNPSYDTTVKGTQEDSLDWIQLDQLDTYSSFREDFDKAFNIKNVTENGMNGKSGCLYVETGTEDRNGNTTLMDALRNKIFVNNYWSSNSVKEAIAKAADSTYTDVSGNEIYQINGAINAYWNLIPNATNPEAFNPTESMSRELFYSMFFRATTPVQEALEDNSFNDAVGGKTNFTVYASKVDEYGFLSVANKSLDQSSYKGLISRAEAVYMIVAKLFPDELSKVTGKEEAFSDTKNAGDLALKAGFKTENSDGTIVDKDRWQSYVLAYSIQHSNDGLQEDLYKAMVVAKDKGIISEDESRWDEAISNSEAIQMVVNAGLALNNSSGYLSESEYGKINKAKFTVQTADGKIIKGKEAKIDTEISSLPESKIQNQAQPKPVLKPVEQKPVVKQVEQQKAVEKPVQQAPVQQESVQQQAPVQQQKPVQQAPVQQAPVQDYNDSAEDLFEQSAVKGPISTDIDVESSLNAQKVN